MSGDAKQVGDKQIMQNTKVEAQPASGRVRFSTTLPSGRKVESEWIKESSKTAGVLQWCEVVRAQIEADAAEAVAKTKRRLQEQRASAPALIVPPGLNGTGPSVTAPGTSSNMPAGQSFACDPHAFIEAQVAAAESRVQSWSYEAQRAQQELLSATNDMRQWQAIRNSLLPTSAATTPTTSTGAVEPIDFSDIDEEQQP